MLSIFDAVLIIILGGFFVNGLFKGLIRMFGSLVGVIVGAWAAAHYYLAMSNWLSWLFLGHNNLGKIVVFIIILTLVSRLVVLLFRLIQKAFDLLSIIPFLKSINKLAGGIFGLAEGVLTVGLIIYMISHYTLISSFFGQQLTNSHIAPFLLPVVNLLTPLFPAALTTLQSII